MASGIKENDHTRHKMRDDPLQIVMIILRDVTGHGAIKLMMTLSIICIQLFHAIGVFIVINENRDLAKYLPSLLAPQIGIYSTYVILKHFTKYKLDGIQKLTFDHSLEINALGLKTQREILKYTNNVKLICIIFILAIFINAFLAFSNFSLLRSDISLIGLVIDRYFKELSWFLQPVYFAFYVVLTYDSAVIPIFLVYCVSHGTIQLHLLKANLARISNDANDFDLIHDKRYQRFVRIVLRQSVIHHLNIKRLSRHYIYFIPGVVICNPILGTLSLVSFVYFLQGRISPEDDCKICMLGFAGLLVTAVYIWYAQQIKDETEHLFTVASRCSWPVWNTSNRRILLLILQNSLLPIKVSVYNMMDVDAVVLINVVSAGYKILVLFNHLNSVKAKQ